ncbi:MAG: hypothetical protein A3A96_01685 [Candidatus Zambryskibacteria bacterium RIFCSPLOWO2_01_FULL_39_39]|uniref:D-alanyl-D-alanine carboxypeptidase-like core domain-containing protein n=1 Tax=Candidatus Zambryskibacteria bacterium RIFCSPLOWO2_01_FULL_39_39 TaxID=1802758 RepID=A0A1G2TVR7_9BACT|nr:MAG: D-alanyl-D-alanine carboxypeptidase family protein [Parcubacteria group bacterium GW2011_GWA1_38_7]OHA86566.1 MAG: hypothetical protein A2644_01805 [Candidatus Zambryskibacteria bacterium RIFCSPHIGHO2_01_FULL_39_63]OHA94265.1 MAG: hypothetical protein A3B88_03910 [Candidatus Zambryskibacteria bacterium RIFCSPHIGHO2_02_FULL_39_19]OHA98468.1 MAG: hypothetical protein A3F20_03585 [Candidatus Zambryskibacteria bacterium RIFCSPHIGHO2_12_FULL_39_21]OHB01386.1 MAG: hypothetical protein A3A96_0
MKTKGSDKTLVVFGVIIVSLLGFLIWGYSQYTTLDKLQKELILEKKTVEEDLKAKTEENVYIFSKLTAEQQKNLSFENQIKDITSQVGTLDKLSKTDKELLQKYSKVYFLNENYVPESLAPVPNEFIYEKDKQIQIHTKVLSNLTDLLRSAQNNSMDLKIISGFRSFGEQSVLKGAYTVSFGSDANKFSADQGYSEHQLGTTVDFTTASVGATFSGFSKTKEYEWLLQNAYKYGFIISYPEGNAYYQFEPWHFRFVGKQLAERLYVEKQNFYDLDQRKIDAYLINIFD